ncbi:MAG: cytochrome c oxidase subunit 4 [Cellulomonadaceae bacterium]|nr:cytochrome c oxidase subunit 4 [Cellulomonadaceae bacterium]
MKLEARLFGALTPFFAIVALIYGWFSGFEAVGTGALILTAALVGMIGFYLSMLSRRIDARPEDDPFAEVADGTGELGVFSPWSWWPLVLASGAAVSFAALAIGWWLLGIGAVIGAIGLVGWVLEFSRGQHAH